MTIAPHIQTPPGLPPGAPLAADGPEALLLWAADRFGARLALATSLGPQSLVLLDMAHKLGLTVPTFFLDTDLLFDATHALRTRIEARYGIRIEAVRPRPSLGAQRAVHGDRLWATDPDRCCALRKVEPLRQHLQGRAAWITGIRRSQGGLRSHANHLEWDRQFSLYKLNPLIDWSREDVDRYLAAHGVPTNPLLDQGYRSVGCGPCSAPVTFDDHDHDERAGRWADSEKTECGIHGRLEVIR